MTKSIKKLIAAIAIVMTCMISFAQNGKFSIRGVVVDTDDPPQTIIGAAVYVKGAEANGVVTDLDGFFSIKANAGDILIVSCIGYKDGEYRVTRDIANLSIALAPDVTVLEQAVVTGMTSQQRKHIASSVSVVNNANFTNKPVTQLSQALSGGTTGILVTAGSGEPGSDNASIKIRGVASLIGSSPLVLVDGFEFDMNRLDPSTVESVSILKDAAAASIYGAKAGNGVILITTKRGTAGTVKVNYNGYGGVQIPMYKPLMADSWDYMKYVNDYLTTNGQQPMYGMDEIEYAKSGIDPVAYPNTKWADIVLKPVSAITEHNFSVSGGNTTGRFAVSAQYLHQDGAYNIVKNGFDRFTIRANSSVNVTKNITLFVDTFLGRDKKTSPAENLMSMINTVPVNIVAKYPQREGTDMDYYGMYYQSTINPLAQMERGTVVATTKDYVSINARPQWNIMPGLTLKGQFGYRLSTGMEIKDQNPYVFFNYYSGDEITSFGSVKSVSYTTRSSFWSANVNLDWVKEIKGHRINLLGGFSAEDNAKTGWDNVTLASFFGKAYYSYNDKYLLEAGLRTDGSSLFSKGHKWGFFPSVAAGWNVSKEDWLKDVKPISTFKLRASYGRLGNNNVGSYKYQSLINASTGYETSVGNPDLRWETVSIYDAGLDLSLFGYKLDITFDWFLKDVNDLIMNIPSPLSSGLVTTPTNVGRAKVDGLELGISYNHEFNENIRLSISAGYTFNKSKWLYIPGGSLMSGNTIYKEGYPLKANNFYITDGLLTQADLDKYVAIWGGYPDTGKPLQQPGDIKFLDMDGDGTITENDRRPVGDQEPHHIFYGNFTLKCYGFDFDMQITGQGNSNRYLYGDYIQPLSSSAAGAIRTWQMDYWTEDNPNASRPRLAAKGSNNEQLSTFWMYNGAFAKIKYIQVGYSFRKLAKKIHASNVRIYVNAQNPFTFSHNKYVDPEITSNGGVISSSYPMFRTITMGLNLSF